MAKVSRDICCFFNNTLLLLSCLKPRKACNFENEKCHVTRGGGMGSLPVSPNDTKNVTYNLNGLLQAKAERGDVINLKKAFFNVNSRHQSSLTPLHCFDFFSDNLSFDSLRQTVKACI